MKKYKAKFVIPVHPGAVLCEVLDGFGASQSELSRRLSIPQTKINEICRGKRGISAKMAKNLGKVFRQSPNLWMGLQMDWELSQVDDSEVAGLKPFRARA